MAALRSIRHLTKLLRRRLKLQVARALPEEYIDRFASQLDLSTPTAARAHAICTLLPKRLKQTKPATLLAAAVLYLAGKEVGEAVTIRKLADALGVGVSSLCQTASRVRALAKANEG